MALPETKNSWLFPVVACCLGLLSGAAVAICYFAFVRPPLADAATQAPDRLKGPAMDDEGDGAATKLLH